MCRTSCHSRRAALAAAVALASLAPTAMGQISPTDSIDSEDLQYLQFLMDQNVTVASAREEKVSNAPGAVTAYTKDDVSAFGFYTLGDLGRITPGYSIGLAPDEDMHFNTRGGTSGLNTKHLVLVDGIPVNHTRNNHAPIQEELPLLFADRIEFLRGPASALYGIGAFNGVVNIVPKSAPVNGHLLEGRFYAGLENAPGSSYLRNKEGSLLLSKNFMGNSAVKTDDVDFQLGAGYYAREASLELCSDTDGVKEIGPYRNNNEAIFARLSNTFLSGPLTGLTLGFIYMDRKNGYGSSWGLHSNPGNHHRFWSAIPYLKHQVAFSEKVKLESYAKANVSTEIGRQIMTDAWVNENANYNDLTRTVIRQTSDSTWDTTTSSEIFSSYRQNQTIVIDQHGDTVSVSNDYTYKRDTTLVRNSFHFDVQSNNIELYSKLSYDITPEIGVLFGVNYDVRWQDGARAWTQSADVPVTKEMVSKLYDKKAHTISFFVQGRGELPLLNGLILTGGVRLDNGYLDKNAFHQFSPRAAGILRITENLTTKLMFATALQAPGAGEVSHNKEKQRDWLDKEYNVQHPDARLTIPDLKAEGTKNTELNITYTASKFMAGVTGFYNVITNRMERIKPASWYALDPYLPDIVWNLEDKSKALGVEVETQFAPTQNLRLRLNGSYTETDNGDANATAVEGIPLAQTNASVQYSFPFGLSAFLSVNGIWKIVTNTDQRTVAQTEFGTEEFWMNALRPKVYLRDGYALVDLTLRQAVGNNASLDLTISNLTNAQYTYVGLMSPAPNINARLGLSTSF